MALSKAMSSAASSPNIKLPFSTEAEKAVLGSVLKNPDSLVLVENMLVREHFFIDTHSKIYEAIMELSAANEAADILTVSDKLRSYEGSGEYFGPAYLVELTESSPVTQNVEYYAKIVKNDFFRRQIITACFEAIEKSVAFKGSIESFVEGVEKEFLKISAANDRKGIILSRHVLEATIDDIQKRLDNEDRITGVASGFTEFDTVTGGFQKSDLIILAARPGMGKTALALNFMYEAAEDGKHVVIFTLEMSKEQLMSRVISAEGQIDSSKLRRGDLDDDERDRFVEASRRIYKLDSKLGIDETPSITLSELRSRCRRHHKEFGLDMIIIDYLQLMGGSSQRRSDTREREISEISMGLKALAKELQIPIIALAQLNRGPRF